MKLGKRLAMGEVVIVRSGGGGRPSHIDLFDPTALRVLIWRYLDTYFISR
jgi:hypothetical protein